MNQERAKQDLHLMRQMKSRPLLMKTLAFVGKRSLSRRIAVPIWLGRTKNAHSLNRG